MFFIPLILSAALDMSLPEFQPERDLSGNYIVSSEDGVVELETLPASIVIASDEELEKSLSLPAPEEDISVNDLLIKSSVNSSRSADVLYSTNLPGVWFVNPSADSTVLGASGSNSINYIELVPGYTYTLSSTHSVYIGNSLSVGTAVTRISDFTITPSYTVYAMTYYYGTLSATYVSSGGGDDPSGDITGNDMSAVVDGLSILNGNVVSGNDQLVQALQDLTVTVEINNEDSNNKFRALIFIALISFLYPIALSIVHNIVGGDSNV